MLITDFTTYPYKHKYTKATLDKIKKITERKSSDVSSDEHLENIKILKMYREEQQMEISYALENKKCPLCDGPILNKGNAFWSYKCDFNFKL